MILSDFKKFFVNIRNFQTRSILNYCGKWLADFGTKYWEIGKKSWQMFVKNAFSARR